MLFTFFYKAMGNRPPALHREVEYSVASRTVPRGLELSEQRQNELVRIFCDPKPINPREVEDLVSGKPGDEVVGSKTFFPQNGKSPFLEAARAGTLASLKFMLERYPHAIDVNGRGSLEKLTNTPRTHPHPTVTSVHSEVTALIASCIGTSDCSLEVVKYLISKGALVNVASCYGTTPLMAAAQLGNVKVLRYLVRCGADVNAVCIRGSTALHYAAHGGSREAVTFLIKEGVSVNHQDHYGKCAIHTAALMGKREVVLILIAEGATTLSSQGSPMDPKYVPSPIILAASQGHQELIEDLQEHCSWKLCSDAYRVYGIFQFDKCQSSIRYSGWNIRYFREAFYLLAKCSDDAVKYLPPCAAYGYRMEMKTVEETKSSLYPGEQKYQALIIKERCLGLINSALRVKTIDLALSWSDYNPSLVERIALLSRVMSSVVSEVDRIPLECIAHTYNGNYLTLWDVPLRWTLEKYSNCASEDKRPIDLTFFLQFIARGLEFVRSSIEKVRCAHGCNGDDISMLTLYGLRFLCFWAQQEKDNGGNQGRDCDNIGHKFTSAYLYAPNDSTLLCQALSPKLLYEDWQRDYTFIKDLVEDLISALLLWGADAAVDDPCAVSGQRPLHMAAEHHNHRVVGSLIEAGAHVDATDRNGETAMDIAIKRGDPEVLAAIPTSPLPLYCQVSRFIATSGDFAYKMLHLPANVKTFIALHDKCL